MFVIVSSSPVLAKELRTQVTFLEACPEMSPFRVLGAFGVMLAIEATSHCVRM